MEGSDLSFLDELEAGNAWMIIMVIKHCAPG